MGSGPSNELKQPQQYGGSDNRDDKVADGAAGGDAEEIEHPGADEGADDADDDVHHDALTAAFHEQACNPAGQSTDDQDAEKAFHSHNKLQTPRISFDAITVQRPNHARRASRPCGMAHRAGMMRPPRKLRKLSFQIHRSKV